VIRNLTIHLFEPCLKASCIETRSAGPKISEIGSVGRPLFERCSLGGAPLFTLAGSRGFLARRRYVWAISAMQDSRAIVSAMGQHIPQRVLSQPVSIPWVAIRKTVNATSYRHDLKIHLALRERRRARNRLHPIVGWKSKGCYQHLCVQAPGPFETKGCPVRIPLIHQRIFALIRALCSSHLAANAAFLVCPSSLFLIVSATLRSQQ
jgi:hypothetical protein